MPLNLGDGLRLQYNLLRPLTDNWVAYHTAQKFQVLALSRSDKESRDRARIDTIFANQILHQQKLNQVVAEALYFAAPYGSCPIHAYWRDDLASDTYEPLYKTEQPVQGQEQPQGPRPGYVDVFAGDPWDTVYGDGSKRSSVQWLTYGRVLPASLVRQAFQHVPGAEKLEGREDMPSASRFQRIVRGWHNHSRPYHGTAAFFGEWGGDELLALICREIAPGVLPEFKDGVLQIVALNGTAETDDRLRSGSAGEPVLLHSGPLPGRRFSCTRFYAGYRADDPTGKPYVADLDDLQVTLNQYVTLEAEFLRRYARPPLKTLSGSMVDDTLTTEDDAVLEFNDPLSLQYTGFLFPPGGMRSPYSEAIERTMEQMFRLGGWQAASRGESKSGDPAAKVIALARADDTVFGPTNQAIRGSLCDLLQTCHALAKQYMTLPWLVSNVTGDELSHLAEPYIRGKDLSDEPPDYVVVSGFGATPEAQAERLTQLVQMMGADQTPLLSTEKFWKLYPDQTLRPPEINANHLREARAQKVNYVIQQVVRDLRDQFQDMAPRFIEQAHQIITQNYRPLRDDPPQLHIETLSQLTQDTSEDPMVSGLAQMRQDLYYGVLEQQQMAQQEQEQAANGGPSKPQGTKPKQSQKRSGGMQAQNAGTVSSEAMAMSPGQIQSDVTSLTQQAQAGAV